MFLSCYALLVVPQCGQLTWGMLDPQEVGKYNEAVECHAEQVLEREHKKRDDSNLG